MTVSFCWIFAIKYVSVPCDLSIGIDLYQPTLCRPFDHHIVLLAKG